MPHFINHADAIGTLWRDDFIKDTAPVLATTARRRGGILPRVVEGVFQQASSRTEEPSMMVLWERSYFAPIQNHSSTWRNQLAQTLGVAHSRHPDPADVFVYGAFVAASYTYLASPRAFAIRKPTHINSWRMAAYATFKRGWLKKPDFNDGAALIINFQKFKKKMAKDPACFEHAFQYQLSAMLHENLNDLVNKADFEKFSISTFAEAQRFITDTMGDELGGKAAQMAGSALAFLISYRLEDDMQIADEKAVEAIRYLHPQEADDIVGSIIHTLYDRLTDRSPNPKKSAIANKLIAIDRAYPDEQRIVLSIKLNEWLNKIHDYVNVRIDSNLPIERVTSSGIPIRVIRNDLDKK